MGASCRVVSALKNSYTLPFQTKIPLSRVPLIQSGYANLIRQGCLQEAVQSLLAKQAMEQVRNPSSLGFYNRLFLVPKPNRWRLILDLSVLNRFLQVKTFKLDTPDSKRGVGHVVGLQRLIVAKEVKLLAQVKGIRLH